MKHLFTMRQRGYITLISTLVVGAVGLSIVTTVLLLGLSSSRSSFSLQQSAQALSLANACTSEALELIRVSTPYVGTDTITFSAGNCTYTVSNTGSETRLINSSGSVGDIIQRVSVIISDINPLITVTSWTEVADF